MTITTHEHLSALAHTIQQAQHIAVLSGAGMSTESGIPDFRSANGLFTRDRSFADVVNIDYFYADPAGFWAAFKEIFKLKLAGNYEPNGGHRFLAELEQGGKRVSVLTQNIDGLHHKAGSSEVLELHGTLVKATCLQCGTPHDLDYLQQYDVPQCRQCDEILKPDVVLYGEAVPLVEPAFELAVQADLMLVLGSSLEVGPVNLIPREARRAGVTCALINLEPTHLDYVFELLVHDRIGATCDKLRALGALD
ncbi:sirtuin NAD-dependent deacetylase [Silvimonas sp. JCM 19000]